MKERFKEIIQGISSFIVWILPLMFLTFVLVLLIMFAKIDFLKYLEILIWPCTVLTALFFFRKVVTYLFFSMNEFNFFGMKGNLKNVNELISEEVEKRIKQGEEEAERQKENEKLSENIKKLEIDITKKQKEVNAKKRDASENLTLAKEVLELLKTSREKNKNEIIRLELENRKLKDRLLNQQGVNSESSSFQLFIDDTKTDDQKLEDDSSIK